MDEWSNREGNLERQLHPEFATQLFIYIIKKLFFTFLKILMNFFFFLNKFCIINSFKS